MTHQLKTTFIGLAVARRGEILATKGHGISSSADTNYFTDADLSIPGEEVFKTDHFFEKLERKTRENLRREWEGL